jgi:chromosome segregation ATPase
MEKAQHKYSQIILIALLAGITLFSLFKYFYALKEKYELTNALSQIKEQVAALEAQRQELSEGLEKEKELNLRMTQENVGLKDEVKKTEEEITQIKTDIEYARKIIEDLKSETAILKAENMAVKDENANLTSRLSEVSRQKDELTLRLGSVVELKKAIRELKKKMRKVSSELRFKEVAHEKVLEGNRGFLIKNGRPTYPTKVKIEVKSLPSNE